MGTKYAQIQNMLKVKEEAEKQKSLKDVVRNPTEFKKDMAKFYGVNPGATKDVNLDLYIGQKGKENASSNPAASLIRPQSLAEFMPAENDVKSQKS